MSNVNKSSSSSSSSSFKIPKTTVAAYKPTPLIDLDSQVVDLTHDKENNNNVPPPRATITVKRQQQQPRKLPAIQVASKKVRLLYDNVAKPTTFFGYKMFYLSRAQQILFTKRVKLFQCNNSLSTNDIRLGVAEIDHQDMMSFTKLLNNVAGSLPVTTKTVKRPMEEGDDVLFISLKPNKATLFDHRGVVIPFGKLPKVCQARIALSIRGMKTKDEEASFILNLTQVMVKKQLGSSRLSEEPPKLLFGVSSSSDDDETMLVE